MKEEFRKEALWMEVNKSDEKYVCSKISHEYTEAPLMGYGGGPGGGGGRLVGWRYRLEEFRKAYWVGAIKSGARSVYRKEVKPKTGR